MITQEHVNQLFDYKNGSLYRKNIKKSGIRAGSLVGFKNNQGYLQVSIEGKKYLVHRLVFFMHYGYFPQEVDHINNVITDNRVENLREASRIQNCYNQKNRQKGISGIKNVEWKGDKKKWRVVFRVNGKSKHFGYFDDIVLAEQVAQKARNIYHGEFANHGI